MKRLALMTLTGAVALFGAAALGEEAQTVNPREFWAGTKPVVWSLRAGSYNGLEPSVSPGISLKEEIAASKPVVWSLLAGKERQAQPMIAASSPCWGTKPVVRALGRCPEETPEVGAASGRP